MDFTTKISEQDFLDAYRLRCNSLIVLQRIATISLYVLTTACGMVIVCAFMKAWEGSGDKDAVKSLFVVLFNILPFEILTFLYVVYLKLYIPFRVRRLFRQDPNHKGEMAVQLSGDGVSEESSIGPNVYFPWAACSRWRESRRVIVLIVQSGIYFIFPKACLSAAQQDELRSELATRLPMR